MPARKAHGGISKTSQGFTLIELMIVIAILGILMAIAIPAYQDYTVRTKVSECLMAAAAPKLSVSESYTTNFTLPASNNAAGYGGYTTAFCNSVTVGANGTILIDVNQTGVGAATAVQMLLTPTPSIGKVEWACTTVVGSNYTPASCR